MLNQKTVSNSLQLICASIGRETYCLDMSLVRGVQRTDLLQKNPGREGPIGWLLGNQGEIPVFSLATQLGRAASAYDSGVELLCSILYPKPGA